MNNTTITIYEQSGNSWKIHKIAGLHHILRYVNKLLANNTKKINIELSGPDAGKNYEKFRRHFPIIDEILWKHGYEAFSPCVYFSENAANRVIHRL